MLIRKGWSVNLKRVHRLWVELGLRRPLRLKKPGKLGPKPGSRGQQLHQATSAIQERRLDMRLYP